MPSVAIKKQKTSEMSVVKKMRDYSEEPAFKKKAEKATAFLKKYGLPKSFKKKVK